MKATVIIPNWNGVDSIGKAIDSLLAQTIKAELIVVDNGSIDESVDYIEKNYPGVTLLKNQKNLGFAGGVNVGIKFAIDNGAEYVALFNNDAVADKDWLKHLKEVLDEDERCGIVTCKLLNSTGSEFDSTGEGYSIWGLPFPRGRDDPVSNKYDQDTNIFAASGGASLYRVKMLRKIDLFDENFFAYYEDVDISFRAQLAGWKVRYAPKAIGYHQIGATSSKIKGFTTYQTLKNLPLLFWKNVPIKLMPRVMPRLALADTLFFFKAVTRGQGWPALKGVLVALVLMPKKLFERRKIQAARQVSVDYIWKMMTHDLPPNAHALRKFRNKWWKLRGKHV